MASDGTISAPHRTIAAVRGAFAPSAGLPYVWGYLDLSEAQSSDRTHGARMISYCQDKGLPDPVLVMETVRERNRALVHVALDGSRSDERAPAAEFRPLLFFLLGSFAKIRGGHLLIQGLNSLSSRLMEQEALVEIARSSRVCIHVVSPSSCGPLFMGKTEDPRRNELRKVLRMASEFRAIMDSATGAAKATTSESIMSGRYCGGRLPFGYRLEQTDEGPDLAIDPQKAEVVRFVFKRRDEKKTATAICAEAKEAFRSSGIHIYHSMVWRILNREDLYRGHYKNHFGHTHYREDLKIL